MDDKEEKGMPNLILQYLENCMSYDDSLFPDPLLYAQKWVLYV